MDEKVLDVANGGAFVSRATDPLWNPSTPGDFSAQYPTPLDTTEILALCDDITAYQRIPEVPTALKQETWREMNSLAFTSGSTYLAFADGACPEEYTHAGVNTTISLKNIGAKKSLTISDIKHSMAIAAAGWNGINALVGPVPTGEGMPGADQIATFQREAVANLKEKEVRLGMTLVMNGFDRLLVNGNSVNNALEFDGIQNWFTNMSLSPHSNSGTTYYTGTAFSASNFDQFLSESCAKPTLIAGTPQAIQGLLSAYFQLGVAASQIITNTDGNRLIPGFNFASFVNTAIGRLEVMADRNFTQTNLGGNLISTNIYALRMSNEGEPLVYKTTQIPLSLIDLVPGCTSIAFEVWAKTALVIKHACAHGIFATQISGRVATTCPTIG
jgi:hypothetical protein